MSHIPGNVSTETFPLGNRVIDQTLAITWVVKTPSIFNNQGQSVSRGTRNVDRIRHGVKATRRPRRQLFRKVKITSPNDSCRYTRRNATFRRGNDTDDSFGELLKCRQAGNYLGWQLSDCGVCQYRLMTKSAIT